MAPEKRLVYIAKLANRLVERARRRQDRESYDLAERISLLAIFSDTNVEANRAALLKGVEDAA